jgi:hypothetical protein
MAAMNIFVFQLYIQPGGYFFTSNTHGVTLN